MYSSVMNFHMPTISKSKTSIFYPNSLFSLRELITFQKRMDLKETFITFQLRFLFRDNFSPSFKLLGQFCKNMSPIIDTSFLGCLLMMLQNHQCGGLVLHMLGRSYVHSYSFFLLQIGISSRATFPHQHIQSDEKFCKVSLSHFSFIYGITCVLLLFAIVPPPTGRRSWQPKSLSAPKI